MTPLSERVINGVYKYNFIDGTCVCFFSPNIRNECKAQYVNRVIYLCFSVLSASASRVYRHIGHQTGPSPNSGANWQTAARIEQ